MVSGGNGIFIDEPGRGLQHLDAEAGKALDAIVRSDTGNDLVDAGMKALIVDDGLASGQTEATRHTDRLRVPGDGNQRLRRHASVVEAIPTHGAAFDQDHGNTEGGGTRRHGKPGGTATDHADIRIDDFCHACPVPVKQPCGATIPA